MDLSIVIVNYKTKGLLKQCLRGIDSCDLTMPYEVLVVDNASHDGSIAMVREQFPKVKLITAPVNVGFGAGMNLGFKQSTGQYVLTLNCDVAIFKDAVTNLIDFLDHHQQTGIAVPKLINPDGTTQLNTYLFPNFMLPLWRRTPLGKIPFAKKIIRRYMMSDWNHGENRPIGWALGGALMIRRSVLEKLEGFDERFFLFVEDTDICRRCWQHGWSVDYVANAEMVHYHQRPSAAVIGLMGAFSYPARLHLKSWLKYFVKYYGLPKPPHSL
jgi:N-acetylglucosaminyl-diphospho-decaprenol L-rhamnosyltransferase